MVSGGFGHNPLEPNDPDTDHLSREEYERARSRAYFEYLRRRGKTPGGATLALAFLALPLIFLLLSYYSFGFILRLLITLGGLLVLGYVARSTQRKKRPSDTAEAEERASSRFVRRIRTMPKGKLIFRLSVLCVIFGVWFWWMNAGGWAATITLLGSVWALMFFFVD